jgi:hypothetical protein
VQVPFPVPRVLYFFSFLWTIKFRSSSSRYVLNLWITCAYLSIFYSIVLDVPSPFKENAAHFVGVRRPFHRSPTDACRRGTPEGVCSAVFNLTLQRPPPVRILRGAFQVPRFTLPLLRSLTGKSTASATIAEQSDLRLTRRSFLGVSGRGLVLLSVPPFLRKQGFSLHQDGARLHLLVGNERRWTIDPADFGE